MNTFEIEYLKIINEENGIKTLCFPTEIKKFNFKSFTPFEHKGVSIFQSSMRDDINHVIERLNERSKNDYTLNDIFLIVKRGIDEFLNLVKTQNFNSKQSFNIISKSYPNIIFGGRLGKYKYYDMHVVVKEALNLMELL